MKGRPAAATALALIFIATLFAGCGHAAPSAAARPKLLYPALSPVPVEDRRHGHTFTDDYRFFETAPDSPLVRDWVANEDRLAEGYLRALPSMEGLKARLGELIRAPMDYAPVRRGHFVFFLRREPARERAVLCRRDERTGRTRVVIDPNLWTGEANALLGGWRVDFQGKRIAYTVVPNSHEDLTRLEVRDASWPAEHPARDVLEGGKYALPAWLAQPSWDPDGRGFYYTYFPQDTSLATDNDRQARAEARYHRVGTPQARDTLIYRNPGDPGLQLDPLLSRDGKKLFLMLSHYPSEHKIIWRPAGAPSSEWRTLFDVPGSGARFEEDRGRVFLLTDWGTPNRKILAADLEAPGAPRWTMVVAPRPDVALSSMRLAGGRLFVLARQNARARIEVYSPAGERFADLAVPGEGSVSELSADQKDRTGFFEFSSLTTPPREIEVELATGRETVWSEKRAPVEPDRFVIEQQWFTSKDGTRVPMFVAHDRKVSPGSHAPALVYAYGAWNVSMEPDFDPFVIPWLEAGGVYALTNIRGGGEFGESWHRAGSLRNKQNSIDDLATAVESLGRAGWADPARIAIQGGSFGGMLVAAALVERPELYRAVLCDVPLTDLWRYALSGIGRNWVKELGSPEDPDDFAALAAYSPYQNIRAGAPYPALLVGSADNDERAAPWHARKFVARLQALVGDSARGPLLLRTQRQAGHGGADLVSMRTELLAERLAFLLSELKR